MGDEATFRESDYLTGVETRVFTNRVTRVDIEADRVEFNRGAGIADLMGNPLKRGKRVFDAPCQLSPAELQVGKKWTAVFTQTVQDSQPNKISIDFSISSRERISVPAGTFDAFRIEGWGWSAMYGTRIEFREWLVPWLNFAVKREHVTRRANGQFKDTERYELVSLRQHVFGD